MIHPERMLGQLLSGSLGRRRRHRMMNAGLGTVGMGLLGVAVAAFEHFKAEKERSGATGPAAGNRPTAPPQPPPGPPPPPQPEASAEQAMLLIRAMIAAAHADGRVDDEERARILGRMEEAGMDDAERAAMAEELESPRSLEELAEAARRLRLQEPVYAAALVAVDADTVAEEAWLERLAAELGLDGQHRKKIEQELGI